MQSIDYAFPLTKRGRLLLKLRNLIEEMTYWELKKDPHSLKGILGSIFNILLLLERIDIKMEISKELEKFQVNSKTINNLDILCNKGKFGESIRSRPLYSQIQKRLMQPGGLGIFDMPALHTWFHLDKDDQNTQLTELMIEIRSLKIAVDKIFTQHKLAEEAATITTQKGFVTISPKTNSCILKVSIDTQHKTFIPEVSASARAVIIKFWQQGKLLDSPTPCSESFSFIYSET